MSHGGKKNGAGCPKGRTIYGETTKPMRIPLSRVNDVRSFLTHGSQGMPLYSNRVSAGFPSPADDTIESTLDLNTHLVHHPAATFFVRASGDSMQDAGIQSGDMLIVDRSLEATHGKIVIAALNGELTVKRLSRQSGRVQLVPANKNYQAIDITDEHELIIWGVVTHVIHEAS